MKKNMTYIIFVVDKSGSMQSIKKDMIGGFNAFIQKQKKVKGDCKIFLYQFDTNYEVVYEGIDIKDISPLTDETYVPRGGTALYPSLGKTIEDIGKKLASLSEKNRPEKVLFVTITDGEDNSKLSPVKEYTQFTLEQVKDKIEHQTQVYKWDFVYIGANQNSWTVGNSMGHTSGTTLNYIASSEGVSDMFGKLCSSTVDYRCSDTKKKFTFGDTTS